MYFLQWRSFLRMQRDMEKMWERIVRRWRIYFLAANLKRQSLKLRFTIRPRRRLKIALSIAALPLLVISVLITIVILDTPSKHVLRRPRSPVASEVYRVGSVLMGRYFVEDRTW